MRKYPYLQLQLGLLGLDGPPKLMLLLGVQLEEEALHELQSLVLSGGSDLLNHPRVELLLEVLPDHAALFALHRLLVHRVASLSGNGLLGWGLCGCEGEEEESKVAFHSHCYQLQIHHTNSNQRSIHSYY